jgi:hypothetical protein
VAEGGALLRRYGGECLHRGFESLLLRFTQGVERFTRNFRPVEGTDTFHRCTTVEAAQVHLGREDRAVPQQFFQRSTSPGFVSR